jgi:hypothetical protein
MINDKDASDNIIKINNIKELEFSGKISEYK